MSDWADVARRPLGDRALDDDQRVDRAARPLGRLVGKRIARAHGVLIDNGRLIGPDTPAEHFHDLRKDAKKLRYLLECFGGMLPDKPRKQYVKRLKALQDNLGEHQDAEVHVALLRDIAGELDARVPRPHRSCDRSAHRTARPPAPRRPFRVRRTVRRLRQPATRRALDAVLEAITG